MQFPLHRIELFLIANFPCVVHFVFSLLGDLSASVFSVPMFWNTVGSIFMCHLTLQRGVTGTARIQ